MRTPSLVKYPPNIETEHLPLARAADGRRGTTP
jgi:hypothetical protein